MVDKLLHLTGVDIFPHGDNHVLDAVHDVDIAVFIHAHHIGGVEPASPQGFPGGIRQVPVAQHDIFPPADELPQLPLGHVMAHGVHHPGLYIQHRLADGAQLDGVGAVQSHHRGSFGQAVDFADFLAEFGLEILRNLHGQGGTGGSHQPQAGHVLGTAQLGEQGADGGHEVHIGNLLITDGAQGLLGGEGAEDDDGGSRP